jgi:hypothetical protein
MGAGPAATSRRPLHSFFSADYATARERFVGAARRAGARIDTLPLAATGPRGEALTIDIAWLGADDAPNVALHTSGIHGVEAFAGSAVQLALLDDPPRLTAGTALALVHVLNPYGMAWLRRTNENNVDLNRNFLGGDERWSGAPALYAALDPLLNARSPPARDAFLLRATLVVLRHGFAAVKQAVAQGQYEFPRGLFYGGTRLEEGPRRYLEWLARRCAQAVTVLAIDVHTGLGPWGKDTLLVEPGYRAPAPLAQALGRPLIDAASGDPASYVVKGSLASGVHRTLPHVRLHAIVQELGSYPVLRVIAALRDENRCHFYGAGSARSHAKQALADTLCPRDVRWREQAAMRGVSAARAGLEWLQAH